MSVRNDKSNQLKPTISTKKEKNGDKNSGTNYKKISFHLRTYSSFKRKNYSEPSKKLDVTYKLVMKMNEKKITAKNYKDKDKYDMYKDSTFRSSKKNNEKLANKYLS
ncbi:uncharacterized protein VNE69_09047 [Vairimorpha necatrix]|uniref:Uncharacterized protein n=1 Tax=Vairimorpha necatrix TaxID=6039 RepID=A0AAX4JET7_9MICR